MTGTATVADAASAPSAVPLVAGGGFLELAVLFVALAVVAAVLGARGIAGVSATIAKWLVLVFLVLAVASLLL